MTRWTCGLLLALVTLPLAGGTASVAQPPAPVYKPNNLASAGDYHRLGYALRWGIDLNVPATDELSHIEVLDDIIVTVETPTNMMTVISATDGHLYWRKIAAPSTDRLFAPFRTPSRKVVNDSGRSIALNDLVMVNSENQVYMFSLADGHYVDTRPLPDAVTNAPAITDNLALFGSSNGNAFGIDLVNGFRRWAYRMPAAIVARPVVVKPSVFVADSSGVYALITAFDYTSEDKPGILHWKGRAFGVPILASPAVNNRMIYVASLDQSLYALGRTDGRDRWIYRAGEPLYLGPITLGNSLYLPLRSGSLLSIDPTTGEKLWSFPHLAKPVLLQDQRLIASGGSVLWIIDNESGKSIQEVATQPLRAVYRADKNSLILVSPAGRIERLDQEN